MKLTHSQKIKKAKRMLGLDEIKKGVAPFNSRAWRARKAAMALRLKNAREKIKE